MMAGSIWLLYMCLSTEQARPRPDRTSWLGPAPVQSPMSHLKPTPSCTTSPLSRLQSEVVVPVVTPDGRLLAVLDVDSGGPCLEPPPACPPAPLPAGRLAHWLACLLASLPARLTFRLLARPSACLPAPQHLKLHLRTPHSLPPWHLAADLPAAFTAADAEWLERLCGSLGARQWRTGL